jgi:hypothetical protein
MAAAALSNLYGVGDVTDPCTIKAMRHRICSDGLALFDGADDVQAMITVAVQVMSIIPHPDSDERGVTTIIEGAALVGDEEGPHFALIYCLISVSAREIWIEVAGANGVAVSRNG